MLVRLLINDNGKYIPYDGATTIKVHNSDWQIYANGSLIFSGTEAKDQPHAGNIALTDGAKSYLVEFDSEARDIYENNAGKGVVEFSTAYHVEKEATSGKVKRIDDWAFVIALGGVFLATLFFLRAEDRTDAE